MCLHLETNLPHVLSSDSRSAFMIDYIHCIHDFLEKHITFSSITCVWVGFASYSPLKVIIYAAIFQLPDIFLEFCTFFFTFISERSGMVVKTLFNFFFASSLIAFSLDYI